MRRNKQRADHRADTRGGSWVGIPKCVVESAAYRDLSLHARAILVEIVANMNGFNNGDIAVSTRDITTSLRCSHAKVAGKTGALVELMGHGFLEGGPIKYWKDGKARTYRLTFVNTGTPGRYVPATHDYLTWTPTDKRKSRTKAVSEGASIDTARVPIGHAIDTAAISRIQKSRGKPVNVDELIDTAAVALISKPSLVAVSGDDFTPFNPAGDLACEGCGELFKPGDRGKPKRFCSEQCRKRAERQRALRRRRAA